jgi:hypothetical protein
VAVVAAEEPRKFSLATQVRLVKSISDGILFQEAKTRRAELIQAKGRYATMKKFRECKGCGGEFSARELRSHDCPSGLSWKKRYPDETSPHKAA